jgi:hypothetical protein
MIHKATVVISGNELNASVLYRYNLGAARSPRRLTSLTALPKQVPYHRQETAQLAALRQRPGEAERMFVSTGRGDCREHSCQARVEIHPHAIRQACGEAAEE